MNTFSKFFLIIFGMLIGVTGVAQLQQIAFNLMSASDDLSFYLGLFYLAIVIFIWGSAVYIAAGYIKKMIEKSGLHKVDQEVSNEQKPNN